jgi:hypothetical protein
LIEMQAQLTVRRFPSALFAFVLALAAALVLGWSLGYALKGASIAPARTQVVVTNDEAAGGPQSDLTRALPTAQPARDESCLFATSGLVC